jgi:hypothetical protein
MTTIQRTTKLLRGLAATCLLLTATASSFMQDGVSVEERAGTIPADREDTTVPARTVGWKQIGEAGAWKRTIAGTAMDGLIYTVEQSGALYVTDPATGKWRRIGSGDFHGTRHMFAVSPDLYTIESSGSLYQVKPASGSWKQLGPAGAWKATIAGTILDGKLFTIESSGALYVTNLETGTWKQIGTSEFHGTLHLFAAGSDLYTIESSGSLYHVNPANGSWRQVGPAGAWKATIAGAVLDRTLYSVETGGGLYATDPTTGGWKQIGGPDYAGTRFMFATAGRLYTIESSGSLYAVATE